MGQWWADTPQWGHPFSYREEPGTPIALDGADRHTGQDYPAPGGTPIYAVADGVVVASGVLGREGAYGNAVFIDHAEGWSSRYGHLEAPSALRVGQEVRRGTLLGRVGSAGSADEALLHLELRKDGEVVDPLPHVQDAMLAGCRSPEPISIDS